MEATVCEKNIGPSYVVDVCKEAGLSPGHHTEKHSRVAAAAKSKAKNRKSKKTFKRRRLFKKKEGSSGTTSSELREGKTNQFVRVSIFVGSIE